jgi:hypothetical protein
MDRRKARQLAARNLSVLDAQWRQRYDHWWNNENGWASGAEPPDQAYATALRNRRPAPTREGR